MLLKVGKQQVLYFCASSRNAWTSK